MVYQVNLNPRVVVHLGAVYAMPSGRYLRVLNQTSMGWLCETVAQRAVQSCDGIRLELTGYFIWYYGRLCWTGAQWAERVAAVAHEAEALRVMRERRELAIEQDIARAKEIDRLHAAEKQNPRAAA